MNDEIKEIIEHIKNYPEKLYCLNENEKYLLLDYITNLQHTEDLYNQLLKDYDELQQENEKWWAILKDYEMDLHDLWNKNNELEQENEMLKDAQNNLEKQFIKEMNYKTRIEKAVEYIKSHQKVFALGVNEEVDEFDYISTSPRVLLNILNGKE